MSIQNLQESKITLEQALHIAYDLMKSNSSTNQRFELNSLTQGLRIYSRDRVAELVDTTRTVITAMTPDVLMPNGETGWSFETDEIIANDAADPTLHPYDVTVMTSCVIRVYARNEDDAREKVNVDSHTRSTIRHYMRENGLEVTDIQEIE